MKKCSKCEIEMDLSFFYNDKSSSDGRRSNCKICSKKYRDNNKDYMKVYRKINKDRIKELFDLKICDPEKKKKYYLSKKEYFLLKSKENYSKNRDKKLEYQIEYQKNNKEKRNIYLIERRKNDPLFKLITNIRNLINNSFLIMNYSKKSRTQEILGCSFIELKSHLESKFEYWMNWENRGLYNGELNYGWDIDHIIPLSSAKNEEDLIKLNHFNNLNPLCSKVNRDIKKNNIEYGII